MDIFKAPELAGGSENVSSIDLSYISFVASQHATKPLYAVERTFVFDLSIFWRLDHQLITKPLMRPISVIVLNILFAQIIEVPSSECNEVIQALLLNRLYEPPVSGRI